jgi:hypothetical protein
MKRLAAATLALVAMTNLAIADGKKLLVLQSEGRADAKTRTAVDAAIVKLARGGGDQITPGEITYTDAAAMVGCKPEVTTCRDEVISSLGVDEIVITTVTPKNGSLEIAVRRAAKGTAKDATVTVATADKVDGLAPLFGVKPVGPNPPDPKTDPNKPDPGTIGPNPPDPTKTDPLNTDPPKTDPLNTDPPKTDPLNTDPPKTDPKTDTTAVVKPLEEPAGSDPKREKRRHRMRVAGMAGGGGMVLLGFILWGAAQGVEGDVSNFEVRSGADLRALQDLERKGQAYAGWGNLFFLGGLGLGGVSTYYYFKARKQKKRATPTTAIAPMLFDRGGGISLTIGGMP